MSDKAGTLSVVPPNVIAAIAKVMLAQQREMVLLKSCIVALLKIAGEAGVERADERFGEYSSQFVDEANLDSTFAFSSALRDFVEKWEKENPPVVVEPKEVVN
jgi:hypothetical protein